MFFSFDTVQDCDGRTNRRTDISTTAKTALCNASRGKNYSLFRLHLVSKKTNEATY